MDSSRCRLNLLLVAVAFGGLAWAVPLVHAQQNEIAKLLAEDGTAGDSFGWSVSIDGDTAIIGAFNDDDSGTDSGSAYVFTRSEGGWTQQAKLLPSDGAEGDFFGFSVSISGDKAIVGAYGDDNDDRDNSGSVYIFTRTNDIWTEQAKLLASDGARADYFGRSVSINNDTAVIGAHGDDNDDNGGDSGSVYIFTRSGGAWTEQAKLLPADGAVDDAFGLSVSIDDDTAVIGAVGDDDNGIGSGSAYVFTRSGSVWTEQAKLLPGDGALGDQFGWSVSINGNSAVIGAYGNQDNGRLTGSAYVFTRSGDAWAEQAKLLPVDGSSDTRFGWSVSISGDTAVIGSIDDDDNGNSSGSAYVFTRSGSVWTEQAKLLPSDGEASEQFGNSVSISDDIVAIGARWDNDNGNSAGSAYIFEVGLDTDGDGLLDDWELNGIPYTGGDGVTRRFMLPGADPNYKDLYVEVDAMSGLSLSSTSISMLETAFNFAPVSNPDGFDGINLHILTDDTNLPHVAVWQTDGCWPLDFDSWRLNWYGTGVERSDPEFPSLLEAKAKAYRYCIVADTAGPDKVGGCAPIPGDNLVIYIGASHLNDSDHAAAFMHELGHNLGLDHGGGDGLNGKPNYPSIMNYVLAYDTPWNHAFWQMDYSREGIVSFLSLNESALDENIGVGTPASYYANYAMPFGVNALDGSGNTVRKIMYVSLDGWKTDFGDTAGTGFQDGSYDTGVVQDLNYAVDVPAGLIFPSEPSPGDTLVPYNDWANISLKLAAAIGPGAPAPVYPTDELTEEAVLWIADNFPTPPVLCPADVNRDGNLDFFDLQVYLNWYAAGDLQADLIADGILDFFDVQEFLNLYAAGCP
jgi:FG-GAP repeat